MVKLRPIFASLCLLGLCSYHPVLAAVKSTKRQNNARDMHQIAVAMQKIEQQMVALHQEMNVLREQQRIIKHRQDLLDSQAHGHPHPGTKPPHPLAVTPHPGTLPAPHFSTAKEVGKQHYTRATQHVPRQFEHHPEKGKPKYDVNQHHSKYYREDESPFYQADPKALPYSGMHNLAKIGGTAVITSPFIHSTYTFDGSDLIVNYSSIKKYVAALEQRKAFENELAAMGFRTPKLPLLEISGELEAQAFGQSSFNDVHDTDLDITTAELDFQALVNDWITGFMSISYDNGPPSGGGRRLSNSNVFLDTAFITLGNFNKSPLYLNVGQNYVPFGSFNSNMVSDPLNKTLFRTKARALVVGYQTQKTTGLDVSAYASHASSRVGKYKPFSVSRAQANSLNLFGGDIQYKMLLWGALHATLGASYMNNITDSNGMQSTSGKRENFRGFGVNSATEVLQHRVPGVDLRAILNYGPINLIGEYDTATRDFDRRDITFNGHGAHISAYHLEGDWSFDLFSKPSSVGLSFGETREALAFHVPKKRYMITFNTSIWKNTVASLEFRHDENYGSHDEASGNNGGPVFMRSGGSTSNAVTGQFDVYF